MQVHHARPVGGAAPRGVHRARPAAALHVGDGELEEIVVVGRVQARIGRLRLERQPRQRVVHLGRLELAQLLALVERAAQDDVEVGADALAHQVDGGERLPLQEIEVGAAERARLRGAARRVAADGFERAATR